MQVENCVIIINHLFGFNSMYPFTYRDVGWTASERAQRFKYIAALIFRAKHAHCTHILPSLLRLLLKQYFRTTNYKSIIWKLSTTPVRLLYDGSRINNVTTGSLLIVYLTPRYYLACTVRLMTGQWI